MTNNRTKDIALIAIMTTMILVFAIFPISLGTVDMAFMALLPVIVITQVKGLKLGMILGAIFGIVSFAVSFSLRSVLSPVFMNPLVSIVPRLFIALTTYFSGKLLEKIFAAMKFKGKVADSVKYGVSGAIGVCTNTVLVLGMMLLIYFGRNYGAVTIGWGLIVAILATNFVIELVITTVLCIPISLTVNKLVGISTPKRNEQETRTNDENYEQ
ncbi:MAG TPA: hypothetical protein VJ903_05380 [Clostridia bacterium]|nr:hypothetical protein [Clostridia bacterium]